MRLRMLKYSTATASAAIALIALGPASPAYAVNSFKIYQQTGYRGTVYNYLCVHGTQYNNLVAPIKSVHNNCNVRVWLQQTYGGTPGYNHCISPNSSVSNMPSTYWYNGGVYISKNSSPC
jgi:hypothetical protein